MFVFKRQFKRYGRPFIAHVQTEGYYDTVTGEKVPPSPLVEVEKQGIILQLNDDDLKHDEGGTLTYEDKKILLDTDKYKLRHKQIVIIDGVKYQVQGIAPYGRYSHFEKVIVKRVSVDDRLQEH